MSDAKNKKDGDWSFNLDVNEKNDDLKTSTSIIRPKRNQDASKNSNNLELETLKINPSLTRQQLFEQLEDKNKHLDEDVIEVAPIGLRIIASIIDSAVMAGLFFLSKIMIPFTLFLFSIPMDRYNFKWILNPEILNMTMTGINFFLSANICIVIPLAFYNGTIGKLLTRLNVRGENQYTITYTHSFLREMILKPLSLVSVIGILIMFSNKRRKILADIILKSYVTKS